MFFFKRHLFHLVNKSPWPLFVGIFLFFVTSGLVFFFHRITLGGFVFLFGLIGLSLVVFFWFRDVCEEATFLGYHTLVVRKGMIKGFFLFIASEFMLFFGFFWAFFHSSLSPAFIFAGEWPQPGIVAVFPLGFPFFNTLLLIISGVVVTMVHRAIALGSFTECIDYLIVTIFLGIFFIMFQIIEYYEITYNLDDGVYASTFYMLTGLHGCHVIVGCGCLLVGLFRLFRKHFSTMHYVGFICSIWYWHFVDVVWIFLYVFVYIWSYGF